MGRLGRGTPVGIAVAIVLAAVPSACGARSADHPRLLLDRATLEDLRARAKANGGAWRELRARCDLHAGGRVEWPDGDDYPGDSADVGEGYQGDGYFPALLNLALCYQTVRRMDATRAARYGERAADILIKMSAPSGPHAQDPRRDSVYGIRFYGLGMAIGYDWVHGRLSAAERARIHAALSRWIAAYESSGFGREHPQGNYFAGYYAAKAAAALATEGESSRAAGQWRDWLNRVHGKQVQPYYARNLAGGGWPEGWNYGPQATLNMTLPLLMARSAKGIDLIGRRGGRFPFATGAARFLLYFSWPDLKTLEDSNALYDSDNPSPTPAWLFNAEAGILHRLRSPFAPAFASFARRIRRVQPRGDQGGDFGRWSDFLFGRESTGGDYRKLPRSYYARGTEMGAVRSSWSADAVWAAFKAGPFVSNPDNGEEFFDKGGLAIVRGGRPFLVNTIGALLRNTPGTSDGSAFYTPTYDNLFADGGPRDLFNVLYTERPAPTGQEGRPRSARARTRMSRFEDRGGYVLMRGSDLEDQYPRQGTATIRSWTRDVFFLRPSVFVVYDRTTLTDTAGDRWLAFHFRGQPRAVSAAGGATRYDVGAGRAYAGTVHTLLPAGHQEKTVDLFNGHKVFRLELRPPARRASERWLTVFDATASPSAASAVTPLSAADGNAVGALIRNGGRTTAVLAGTGSAARRIAGRISYTVPAGATTSLISDLPPLTGYSVRTRRSGANLVIDVSPGGARKTSRAGALFFRTSSAGGVSAAP